MFEYLVYENWRLRTLAKNALRAGDMPAYRKQAYAAVVVGALIEDYENDLNEAFADAEV